MDNQPIGFFDSGLGGLTALKIFHRLQPGENIIYFGDSGRMPYGDRTVSELKRFAVQNVDFLRSKNVRAILVACGTLSSVAMSEIQARAGVPVVGVITPAAAAAARSTRNGRVGVIATRATIENGAYQAALLAENPELRVTSVACPDFVPMIESGVYRAEDPRVQAAVEKDMAEIKAAGVDTLLLGCTHYPLLAPAITAYLGEAVTLVSNSGEAAAVLSGLLDAGKIPASGGMDGQMEFYTSGDPARFAAAGGELLGADIRTQVAGLTPFDKQA